MVLVGIQIVRVAAVSPDWWPRLRSARTKDGSILWEWVGGMDTVVMEGVTAERTDPPGGGEGRPQPGDYARVAPDAGLAVEAVGVYKNYPGARALAGLDVQIPRGVIVGLLGPNGSGKSTFLKMAAGLVRPSHGLMRVLGREVGLATKGRVAYAPENNHLYRWMGVAEAVDFAAGFFRDMDVDRARSLCAFMKLRDDAAVGSLSKGQQGRLKLVLALSRRAELILLDEPLAGIDPPSRERILNAIVTEYRSGHQTIIISTHEVKEAEPVFDEVVFLKAGKIALRGAADELRRSGRSLTRVFEEVYE